MAVSGRRVGVALIVLTAAALFGGGPARGQGPPRRSPEIGPELPVGSPVMGIAHERQAEARIAAGEGGFLTVWSDRRRCCGETVYASRIDTQGNVLDPVGIPVSDPIGATDSDPRVAWDGSNYVVVWEDTNDGVQAARVTAGGEVLDKTAISVAIGNDEEFVGAPDVASVQDGALVVWERCRVKRNRCDRAVLGALLDADGRVGEHTLLVDGGAPGAASVAASDDGYLLAWDAYSTEDSSIRVMALDDRGLPTGPPAFLGRHRSDGGFHVAYSDGTFLIIWNMERRNARWLVLAARVAHDGAVIDSPALTVASGRFQRTAEAVSADEHGGWAVVWTGPTERMFGSRVTPEGVLTDPEGILLVDRPGAEIYGALAFLGTRATLVWTGYPSRRSVSYDDGEVYVASGEFEELRLDEPRLVTNAPNDQTTPSIAWDGEVFLVAWVDVRENRRRTHLYAGRITDSGEVLDGSGFRVAPPGNGWTTPAVASDGDNFLVAWTYGPRGLDRDVIAVRVSPQGRVLDDEPIVVSDAPPSAGSIQAVWTGETYFLVWDDDRSAAKPGPDEYSRYDSWDIYGARVTAGGEVLDPNGIALAERRRTEEGPDVAVGEDGALLAWTRGCRFKDTPGCTFDVVGALLTDEGEVREFGLEVAASQAHEAAPSVTATDRGYLVSWVEWIEDEDDYVTALRRISPSGDLGPTRTVSSSAQPQSGPHIDWSGEAATLAWSVDGICFDCGGNVVATRVASSGIPMDDERTPVASASSEEWVGDLASTGTGCTAIAYERKDSLTFGVQRSFVRLFGDC